MRTGPGSMIGTAPRNNEAQPLSRAFCRGIGLASQSSRDSSMTAVLLSMDRWFARLSNDEVYTGAH